jgi:uncharacterized protein YjbJ (UPF0337 family)
MTTQTSAQSGSQDAKERAAAVGGTAQEQASNVAGTAKEQAGHVAGTAKEQAGHVAGTAKDQALEVAGEAKAQARDLAGELRGQVQQQTGQQRDRLVQLVREFSDELEQMASNGGGQGLATEVVRQAAQRLRGVQSYVEGGDTGTPGDLVADVRRFARRRPGAFLLVAATAGVLAGRATRSAAAARKAESEGQRGRHVAETVDVREDYVSGYATQGYTGTTAGYRTGDAEPLTGTGAYTEGSGYGGTAAGSPTAGIERTSDPNLAPTSGPYADAGGNVLGDPNDPFPPDLGGRDAGAGTRGTTTGYEGTR